MALVKMDMTEYEALKKVEALLEDAVKREKKLGKKLETAQQEKIDAYKANEKTVTILKEVRIVQQLQQLRPIHEINSFIEQRIAEYMRHIEQRGNQFRAPNFRLDGNHHAARMMHDMDLDGTGLANIFFEVVDTEVRNQDNSEDITIIRKGLDEVTEEIRVEETAKAVKKAKLDLDELDFLKRDNKGLRKSKTEMMEVTAIDKKLIEGFEKQVIELGTEMNSYREKYEFNEAVLKGDTRKIKSTKGILKGTILRPRKALKSLRLIWST